MDLQWKRDMRQGVMTCLCEVGLGCGAFPWIGGAQQEKQMVFGLEGLKGLKASSSVPSRELLIPHFLNEITMISGLTSSLDFFIAFTHFGTGGPLHYSFGCEVMMWCCHPLVSMFILALLQWFILRHI